MPRRCCQCSQASHVTACLRTETDVPHSMHKSDMIANNNTNFRTGFALNDFGNRWCKREYVEPDALKEWKVSIFKIVDQRIKFYSQNTNLLPPKPKFTFRHLKQGIQDFHRKYVLVPADKAANNVVVVWRLHYINTLKQELSGTKAYKETSEEEKSVVNGHCNHLALKFSVCVKEHQDRLPTMYWLPKLHKRPY